MNSKSNEFTTTQPTFYYKQIYLVKSKVIYRLQRQQEQQEQYQQNDSQKDGSQYTLKCLDVENKKQGQQHKDIIDNNSKYSYFTTKVDNSNNSESFTFLNSLIHVSNEYISDSSTSKY